jgi:ArsR family transcriptional regulator
MRIGARPCVGRCPTAAVVAAGMHDYTTARKYGCRFLAEVPVGKLSLTPEVLALIAERFKALAEPARLQILTCLRRREMTVTELVDETGLGQANVSKHLQLLHSTGFVERRKEGLFVCYKLADESVFQLCDMMCGRLEAELKSRRKLFAS